jgi:hypothetical protein
MRVSVYRDDPGLAKFRTHQPCKAYLNGVEMHNVVMADEEQGVLERYQTDDRGNLVIRGSGHESSLITETLQGLVRIVVPLADPVF